MSRRMRSVRRETVRWGLPLFTLLPLVALSPPARAEKGGAAVVWYRGSPECPAGGAFLEKLGERARLARLADAGDHIDFVVTLVATPAETVGRLERQTLTGTVAIRELRDAHCENVADALALSLGLSLDPEHDQALATTVPAEPPPTSPAPPPPNPPAPEAPPAAVEYQTPRTATAPTRDAGIPTRTRRASVWSTGAGAGILMGISPEPMALGAAFVDYDGRFAFAPQLSLRAGLTFARGSVDTVIGPVTRTVITARGEACPLRWGGSAWRLRPCLSMELGATTASSERQTSVLGSGLWAAPGLGLRGSVDLAGPVALELQSAAGLPVPRREVDAAARGLYRDAPVVFEGTLAFLVRL